MGKVEAYKNSKGELFENEKEYILSEAVIQRERILKEWDMITNAIKSKPEAYYLFIKNIGDRIIDKKNTKEDLQKQYDDVVEIFNKEKDIKLNNYKCSGDMVEYEPYIWGNDILPGFDVNR